MVRERIGRASVSRSQGEVDHLDREDEAAVSAVGGEQLTSTRRWRGLEGGQDGEVVGKTIWENCGGGHRDDGWLGQAVGKVRLEGGGGQEEETRQEEEKNKTF